LHNWNLAKGREYLGSLNAERSNYKIYQNISIISMLYALANSYYVQQGQLGNDKTTKSL